MENPTYQQVGGAGAGAGRGSGEATMLCFVEPRDGCDCYGSPTKPSPCRCDPLDVRNTQLCRATALQEETEILKEL